MDYDWTALFEISNGTYYKSSMYLLKELNNEDLFYSDIFFTYHNMEYTNILDWGYFFFFAFF